MKILTVGIVLFVSMVSFAATPTVTDVTAKQRFPWNGLVDITCTVSGIDGTTNGLYLAVAAVHSGSTNNVSHFWVVKNGTKTTDLEVHTNGNYQLLWDSKSDLGAVIYSNMVVRVAFDSRDKVQLWEGGPYWATTNIGAEEPWECGYYFWWGDIVGYKRENDAWVASDGSSSNFLFDPVFVPTWTKDISTLQSEGWITADNVLAPAHDAAQMQWGGGWRMPTDQELSDLINSCDWTQMTTNGVNGYVVRGKGDYATNSIFLPCAGYGRISSLSNTGPWGDDGVLGYFWSAVPVLDNFKACSILIHVDYPANQYMWDNNRIDGLPVRPVHGFSE